MFILICPFRPGDSLEFTVLKILSLGDDEIMALAMSMKVD